MTAAAKDARPAVDLAELIHLKDAASPLPWDGLETARGLTVVYATDGRFVADVGAREANARYMLAAANAVPALVARIREMEAAAAGLENATLAAIARAAELRTKLTAARSLIPEGVATLGTPAQPERSRACCQYCGWECPSQEHRTAREAIIAHAAVCERHPQRAVEARVKDLEAEVAHLTAKDSEWWRAARTALADQLDPPHGWSEGDPLPEPNTAALYNLYRGCGWTDQPACALEIAVRENERLVDRLRKLGDEVKPVMPQPESEYEKYRPMPEGRAHKCHSVNPSGYPTDWIEYDSDHGFELVGTNAFDDGSIADIVFCPWCGVRLMTPEDDARLSERGRRNRAGIYTQAFPDTTPPAPAELDDARPCPCVYPGCDAHA